MPVIAIGAAHNDLFPNLSKPYHADPYPSPPPSEPTTSPEQTDTDQVPIAGSSRSGIRQGRQERQGSVGDGHGRVVESGGGPSERHHFSNNSIDSGIAFNKSPTQVKTMPMPTHPLPEVDMDMDEGMGTGLEMNRAESLSHQHQSLAGPSSPTTSTHVVPPPAQPRRHRSGVLMSQARSRSRAHTGGNKGFISSKSFGDLNLMGLQMSAAAAEGEGEEGEDMADEMGRRITSEGSSRIEEWDNR